jgi:hypothetical protein
LVGKDSVANALIRHFGSLKALSRASFRELRQFLTRRQAEAVMAALSLDNVAESEYALLTPLTNAEAIYKANLDVIVGQAIAGQPGYFSFQEAGLLWRQSKKQPKALDIKRLGRPEENGSFQGDSCLLAEFLASQKFN